MRAYILIAAVCMLIPAAALAQEQWQRTSDNLSVEPASPTVRIGPGHHIVGPKAALLRSSAAGGFHIVGPTAALLRILDGGGFHIVGPTAALLRIIDGGGFHLLGPRAAPSGRPGDGASRRGSAE